MNNKNLFKEMFFTLIPLMLTNSLGILKYITNAFLVGNFLGGKAISVLSNTFPITLIFYAISIAFSTNCWAILPATPMLIESLKSCIVPEESILSLLSNMVTPAQ